MATAMVHSKTAMCPMAKSMATSTNCKTPCPKSRIIAMQQSHHQRPQQRDSDSTPDQIINLLFLNKFLVLVYFCTTIKKKKTER